MDEEEMIMLTLLRAEERKSKRPYVGRRHFNIMPSAAALAAAAEATSSPQTSASAPAAAASASTHTHTSGRTPRSQAGSWCPSTQPQTGRGSEEDILRRAYEAAGLGVPDLPKVSPAKTPPRRATPSTLAGAPTATPASTVHHSDAEEIDRSDLLEEYVPNESFKQSVDRLLATVQAPVPSSTPVKQVERALDFAPVAAVEEAALRLPRTPASTPTARQNDLLKLFASATLDKEEEVRSLQQQLGRRFALSESGVSGEGKCVIAKLPESPDGADDMFSGDAAVSALVNICDGVLCRLIAHRAARVPEREGIALAIHYTDKLLSELESELQFVVSADEQGVAPGGDAVPQWAADIDVTRLRRVEVLGGDLGAAMGRVADRADALRQSPHVHPVLRDIVAGVEGCLAAAELPLAGGWTDDADDPPVHDGGLVAELRGLKAQEEAAKAAGHLDASAKLRVEALQRQAAWLKGSLVPQRHDTEGVMQGVRGAVDSLSHACGRQGSLAAELAAQASDCKAAVKGCQGVLAMAQLQHEEQEATTRVQLADNDKQAHDIMDKLEALQLQLERVYEDRCKLVKQRVVKVGEHAMAKAVEQARLAKLEHELHVADARAASLQDMGAVATDARNVSAALACVCRKWENDVAAHESEKLKHVEEAVQRVWTRYEGEHETWCRILERSVSAMDGRKTLLQQLLRDAEERYDEGDRDYVREDAARVGQHMEELSAELANQRRSFIDTYSEVREWVRASPSRSDTALSPEIGLPSPEEASPGYQSSLSPVRDVAISVTPQALETMRHLTLTDAVAALGKEEAQTKAWISQLHSTDLRTVADLYHVYSVPTVWRAFLPQLPLLKTELTLMLQRHTSTSQSPRPVLIRPL